MLKSEKNIISNEKMGLGRQFIFKAEEGGNELIGIKCFVGYAVN